RTQEAPAPKHPAVVYAQEVMLENWVGKAFSAVVRARPQIAPRAARIAAKGLGRATKVDASYKVFASERHIKFTEMEWAVPRDRAREFVERVLEHAATPELHV